jgi:hypothetical protein
VVFDGMSSRTNLKSAVFRSKHSKRSLGPAMCLKDIPRMKILGSWCNNVRVSYKQIKEEMKPHCNLSSDMIKQLENIGLVLINDFIDS